MGPRFPHKFLELDRGPEKGRENAKKREAIQQPKGKVNIKKIRRGDHENKKRETGDWKTKAMNTPESGGAQEPLRLACKDRKRRGGERNKVSKKKKEK